MGWIRVLLFRLLVFCLVGFVGFVGSASAQTFSEWFAQKKTQKRYLLEQIAALEVYLNYGRQGYKLVGSGLETVRGITSGELGLHDAFFSGLKLVSPVVKGDSRVAEILLMQTDVVRMIAGLRSAAGLDAVQAAYLGSVCASVLGECYSDLEELLGIVVSGNVDLSDDERLLRLERLYHRSIDKKSFIGKFSADVGTLLRSKKIESDALENLRRYYGLD
ncbi:hypothetical protein [Pedobacter aquatilis]|uniref:hypothetical protein n=1 Tax=Pedobacter aquatilis TaxID=351343 RepID=UPI002930DCF3|nr:hypothetical protein [Pedobacter aquatilis]